MELIKIMSRKLDKLTNELAEVWANEDQNPKNLARQMRKLHKSLSPKEREENYQYMRKEIGINE